MTKENYHKKHPLSKKLQKEIKQRDEERVASGKWKWIVDRVMRCKKLVRIK